MRDVGKNAEAVGTPNGMTRLEQLKTALLGPASTLYAAQKFASHRVSSLTKASFGRMVDAHLLVTGVLAGVLLRTNGKRTQNADIYEERKVLFASYVVGMTLCEQAIEEGRYLQALTLLRQEMETLAQIVTSHAGRRKPGKTANVSVLGKDISRIYGELSAAAHASNHDMASGLLTGVMESEEAISRATYFYPVENMKLARQSFALHLVLTMNLIGQMAMPKDAAGLFHRRAIFYPYTTTNYTIQIFITLGHGDIEKLAFTDITITYGPAALAEKIDTWKDVYGIDERYKAKLCGESDGKYWLTQILDEWRGDGRHPADFLTTLARQAHRRPYAECNFLKNPFLTACQEYGIFENLDSLGKCP